MAQGVELATGYVSLTVSARGIAQEIQRELGDPVDRASKDAGRSIEEGIGGGATRGAQAAKAALSVIGSAAVLSGINRAKDAASGLQQAVGGTAAVFGEASAAVDEFAEGAAESVGLSERATRDLTSRLGASLKGYGFAVDEAADKSIVLTQLGADLAATFGRTTAEAVEALGSALRGEFDPLESFGIALRQSAIDARAVELGLADSTASVDSLGRAQAALSLIMEQSADAQGQFGREAGSAAQEAQISAAKVENSAADLGEALLPIYAQISETVGTVADVFSALPGPVQTGILALAGIVAVAGPISNVVGLYHSFTPAVVANTAAIEVNAAATNSAVAVQNLYAGSTARATIAARAFSTALKVGAAVLAGYAIGAGVVGESRRRATEEGEGLADQFEAELAAATTYEQRAAILNQRIGEYNDLIDDANSGVDIFHNDDLARAAEQIDPFLQQQIALTDVIAAYAEETGDADEATRLLGGSAEQAALLLDQGLTPAEAAAQLASEALAEETEETTRVTEEFAEAVQAAKDALSDLFDISETLPVIETHLRDALSEAADEATRLAEAQADGQERHDAFIRAISSSITDLDDYTQAILDQGGSAEDAAVFVNGYIDELFDLADEFGLTRQEAEDLRTQLGLDYPTVTARVEQVGLAETNQELAELYAYLASINEFVVENDFSLSHLGMGPSKRIVPRAHGGPMEAGQSYLFEGHPEVITMGPGMWSAQVTPLADLAAPAGGGSSVNFNAPVYGEDAVGAVVRRELKYAKQVETLVSSRS